MHKESWSLYRRINCAHNFTLNVWYFHLFYHRATHTHISHLIAFKSRLLAFSFAFHARVRSTISLAMLLCFRIVLANSIACLL